MGSSPLLLHQQAEVLAAEGGGAEAPGPIKARPVPVAPARYTPGFTLQLACTLQLPNLPLRMSS